MLDKKEITIIVITTIILGFAISLLKSLNSFLYISLIVLAVLLINIFTKKITAYYLDTEIKINFWELKRMGIMHFFNLTPFQSTHPSHKLKNPFQIGIILTILTTVLSMGYVIWMAILTFDIKSKVYRSAKRYGLYSFSEVTEYHEGLIAASGIAANLIFAIIGYLIGIPELTKINIMFAVYNIIPISNLDGNKIFFGSLTLWSFLTAIILVALGLIFFVI